VIHAISFDLLKAFQDEEAARLYIENYYWKGKPTCPKCNDNTRQFERKGKRRSGYYICHNCGLEYTVRTGTLFERSHIPLRKWLLSFYLFIDARKGIPSLEFFRKLAIKKESAWFMLHRIHEACKDDGSIKLQFKAEADGLYFGGKEKNRHASKKLNLGRGPVGKIPVLVMKERSGRIIVKVLEDTSAKTIQAELNANIDKYAILYTDEHPSYQGNQFKHEVVNHFAKEFVRKLDNGDKAHVNSVENFNSLAKKSYYGIHYHWSRKHAQRFLDGLAFRQNEGNQKYDMMTRIHSLLDKFKGKRLTYKRLISKPPAQLTENIKFNHPYKTKTGNNIMDKPIRKPLTYKSFNVSQPEYLNENEGYKMNTRLAVALRLGSLMFLNEALKAKNPNGKPILEFKNPFKPLYE